MSTNTNIVEHRLNYLPETLDEAEESARYTLCITRELELVPDRYEEDEYQSWCSYLDDLEG